MKLTTAKTTGLLYLGVAVTGAASFLFASNKLYVEGAYAETFANLLSNEGLARFGIAAELALVVFQALAAIWFFKLFQKADKFNASLIAVFGMVNAIAIMVSSAAWYSALQAALAQEPMLAQSLFDMHNNIWAVCSLFFGLWLIPMGLAAKSARLPRALGWVLVLGGAGYVLSAFTRVLLPDVPALTDTLPMIATIGEFWMIGYLLFKPLPSSKS